MHKPALRRQLLARRAARTASPQHVRAFEAVLRAWLARYMEQRNAQTIGAYWAVRGEFDPLPVLRECAAAHGSVIALPVVDAARRTLRFHAWQSGGAMANNAFGIAEPVDTPQANPDLLLVPALGWAAGGWRLGYGGGFYDRTLAAFARKPFAAALCWHCGRMADFVPEAHDVALDAILTEAGVVWPELKINSLYRNIFNISYIYV